MLSSPLPNLSKVLQLNLQHDIPHDVVKSHLSEVNEWFKQQIESNSRNVVKISNEDIEAINLGDSKRMQVPINGRIKLFTSALLSKYLLPYLKNWGMPFNMEVIRILLLVSEDGCEAQAAHIDDNTGADDFIVAVYSLADGTNFQVQNELLEKKPLINYELPSNTLVFLHSSKVHAGGMNISGRYNFRYHFRFQSIGRKCSSNSDEVGLKPTCKWFCGREYGNNHSKKSHERYCDFNPNGAANYQKKLKRERENYGSRKKSVKKAKN